MLTRWHYIALGAPLTVNLQRRATAELETQALITAQGVAVAIGPLVQVLLPRLSVRMDR